MAANGKLPASALVSILGVKLNRPTANALKRAIAGTKTKITIALPGGGYRSWNFQRDIRLASIGNSLAEKQKYNLNPNSTVRLATEGTSSHGWGTRVDILFNGSSRPTDAQIAYMRKFGFTREFGSDDPNHFKHDGKTAITAIPKKAPVSNAIEGVDYSYSRPTPAQIKSAGKKFVVRYITNPGPGNKGISQSEYDSLKKADIEVVVVWEGGAADMKKGKSQGVADAKAAQKNLKAIVGLNDNLPVYFACDFDATPAQQGKINEYLDGAASVLGKNRVGVYGSYFVCKRVQEAEKATYYWQTYAWSGGKVLDGIHLHQYKNDVGLGSGRVDLTRALKKEYGQTGVKPAATTATPPKHAAEPTTVPVYTVPAGQTSPTPTINIDTLNSASVLGLAPVYFRGDAATAIYVLLPFAGAKRHITPAEWAVIKAAGLGKYETHPQDIVDQIPTLA